jgi:hypothetical protein
MGQFLSGHKDYDFVDLAPLGSARFIVTVDTEEEFDWSAPFSREKRSVGHIAEADRFQRLCRSFGVKPIYVVDHPIASNPAAVDVLGRFAADKDASIGLHLHPWVNPPFVEAVTTANSYASNLSAELEREKLHNLYNLVSSAFQITPNIYRAGRYGAGANTLKVLEELGIDFDTSVRSNFDYSADAGPNFALEPVQPYWVQNRSLIEIPVTTVFGGALRKMGPSLFGRVFNSSVSRSVLSRTALLERITLTPEGIPVDKALQAIELALESGVGILNFSFHSPSWTPGFTPYVRNNEDLESFYSWWEQIFEFLEARGVRPISLDQLSDALIPTKANNSDLALARIGSSPLSARHSGL